jgi:hypothetical protein
MNTTHPLLEAVSAGDLEKVKTLLEASPDLSLSKDIHGQTPLHLAAANGHKDVAQLLLSGKANVNAKDDDGWLPLHKAAYEGHKDLVELLVANGAWVGAQKNDGYTALTLAESRGYTDVAESLRRMLISRAPGLWHIRWWCAAGVLACTAFALFFLLKGQDDRPYIVNISYVDSSGSLHSQIFAQEAISAYTYYFTWPKSRRENLRALENASIGIQLMLRGFGDDAKIDPEQRRGPEGGFMYRGSQLVADPPLPDTLSELARRNISLAIILGIAALATAIINVFLNFRARVAGLIR